MGVKTANILIDLRTVIVDHGEKELSIIKQTGKYVKKGEIEVISFVEKSNDFGKVNNQITIRPERMNIKRSGTITMNQQFIQGKRTECLYRHPYGSFLMEICTKSITHHPLNESEDGKVVVVYEVKLDKEEIRRHHLTLTYTEEMKE